MSQQTFLDALRSALENNINQGSCLPKEPFMKLENGTAPTLNYQIEQKSGFKAYSFFSPAIPKTSFSDVAQEIPANNFFQRIANAAILGLKYYFSFKLLDLFKNRSHDIVRYQQQRGKA